MRPDARVPEGIGVPAIDDRHSDELSPDSSLICGSFLMARSIATSVVMLALAMTSFTAAANKGQSATTVSLTSSVHAEADAADRESMVSLLALLEVDVASRSQFSVVERRQIDLALLELSLSEGFATNSKARLRMGKLASADLILTLELLKPDDEDKTKSDGDSTADSDRPQRALIRIVESLTGVIRGVSVVSIEASRFDEAADQIADYLTLIEAQPERPPVTVAVAPFESLGRFDRLRPLELGLRDMVATRLRLWSDRLAAEGNSAKDETSATDTATNGDSQPRGFRVLQRSNMQELLREFDLIQSALVDRNRLPKTLPTRAAAFLVRGTVDEKNDGGTFRIVVDGELIHAASNRPVRDFRFEVKPEELETALAHQVDLFAGRLVSSNDEVSTTPGTLRERNEVDLLFGRVASDLRRLRRIRAIDFSHRGFELPGRWKASGPQIVDVQTPLRAAILRKSIDRLESTLFIRPDRLDAAYSLGFCYSFHIPGIWKPDRADELLRRSAASQDEQLRAVSLRLLAEISFHHQTGRIPEGHHDRAAAQLLHAFRNMPEKYRDHLWSRLPATLESLVSKLKDESTVLQMLDAAVAEAERPDGKHGYYLALGVRSLLGLAHGRDARSVAAQIDVLKRWAEGDHVELRKVATWTLGQRAERQQDYEQAADWYRAALEAATSGKSTFSPTLAMTYRKSAAKCLRLSGQPAEALEVLQAFDPKPANSLAAGYYSLEIALCYRDLEQPEKALEIMVSTAERVRSLRDNTQVERYIRELGGVPLNESRDVDVTYPIGPNGKSLYLSGLATDGTRLFGAYREIQSGLYRVMSFDTQTEEWETLTNAIGVPRLLSVQGNVLWTGTKENGIWRGTKSGNDWRQWSTENGLPDNHVVSLITTPSAVFAGLGSRAAGGVVRIDSDGTVNVLDGTDSPSTAPEHLVIQAGRLLAAAGSSVYEMDLETEEWIRNSKIPGRGPVSIFSGRTNAWSSRYRAELAPYRADENEIDLFNNAWFKPKKGEGASGFLVHWVVDQGDQVWYGGSPWARFRSIGLYRFDRRTGEFHMYSPRDGFRMSTTYSTGSAVAIGNDLYVSTSGGLARVTPR